MSNLVTNVAKSHKRRRWIWLAALLALPFCVQLLTWGYVWWTGNHKLDQLLAELDREDSNWRRAHLDRKPLPPPEQNGMNQVLAAINALPNWRKWPAWPLSEDVAAARLSIGELREAMTASLDETCTSVYPHFYLPCSMIPTMASLCASIERTTASSFTLSALI